MCQCNSRSNRACQRACEKATELFETILDCLSGNDCSREIRANSRTATFVDSYSDIAAELCALSRAFKRSGCNPLRSAASDDDFTDCRCSRTRSCGCSR